MIKKLLIISMACLATANVCWSQEFVDKCRMYMYVTKDVSGRISQDEIDDSRELYYGVHHPKLVGTPKCKKIIDTILIVEIFHIDLKDSVQYDCEMFLDGTFLDNIVPEYWNVGVFMRKKGLFKRRKYVRKSFVCAWHIEYDKQYNFWESYDFIYDLNSEFKIENLMRIIKEYNIVSLYSLGLYNKKNDYFIGATENKDIYFLRSYNDEIEVYPAKEFKDDRIPYMLSDENGNSKWNCNKDD